MNSFSGETVLRGDDFKRFVSELRAKSNVYKERKAELSDLRAEFGVLSRTAEILQQREARINDQIAALEKERGVAGFRDTQEDMEKVCVLTIYL